MASTWLVEGSLVPEEAGELSPGKGGGPGKGDVEVWEVEGVLLSRIGEL